MGNIESVFPMLDCLWMQSCRLRRQYINRFLWHLRSLLIVGVAEQSTTAAAT
jgi:hypothetical protein